MGKLGMWEILLILVVLLLLFGATRLPQLGSSLGSAIRNFKKGFGGEDEPPEAPKKQGTLQSSTSAHDSAHPGAKVPGKNG